MDDNYNFNHTYIITLIEKSIKKYISKMITINNTINLILSKSIISRVFDTLNIVTNMVIFKTIITSTIQIKNKEYPNINIIFKKCTFIASNVLGIVFTNEHDNRYKLIIENCVIGKSEINSCVFSKHESVLKFIYDNQDTNSNIKILNNYYTLLPTMNSRERLLNRLLLER